MQHDFKYVATVAVGDVISTSDGNERVTGVRSDTVVSTVPSNGKGTPLERTRPASGMWHVVEQRSA